MGAVSFRASRPAAAQAPIFYTEEFFQQYASNGPVVRAVTGAAAESAPQLSLSDQELKASERLRILAELREQELGAAEAAAQRIGSWASELQRRSVPCLAEQAEVERCYGSPPGGDQLRCGPVVDAFVRCAKL
mmetsp:Transcript_22961/g.41076  ORF Transcript_22961/g.41076 Transcript_22961/m.41076 type:complete len:133 (+) Transcript_22961:83-481(+)